MTDQDNDVWYGRYITINTLYGRIEIGVRIEAKDFKSPFFCLLCMDRGIEHQGYPSQEDLIKHVEEAHPDLAYIWECFMRNPPSQAKMIV